MRYPGEKGCFKNKSNCNTYKKYNTHPFIFRSFLPQLTDSFLIRQLRERGRERERERERGEREGGEREREGGREREKGRERERGGERERDLKFEI